MQARDFDIDAVTVREYTPDDADDLLSVRNSIFPPLTLDQWLATTATFTASLAYLAGEPVGAIPMDIRRFVVAPGRTIAVAQENAVGVREDMRGRGIGSKMIAAAAEFLRNRCDMLAVYRGAERSIGYNFYARTGHCDLLYLRRAQCDNPSGELGDVAVLEVDALADDGLAMLDVFEACYGGMGGFPLRSADYWPRQLASHIYVVLPHEFFYLRYPAKGRLQGYAILGRRLRETGDGPAPLGVLEISALDESVARALIAAAGHLAAQRSLKTFVYVCEDHPFRAVFRQMGYAEGLRSFMIMGRTINPQRLLLRSATDLEPLADLVIRVWTPTVDYTLWEGERPRRRITLEGKDWVINRLLARRLDVRAAVAGDLLTICDGRMEDVQALARVLPYCRWVYHHIDYI